MARALHYARLEKKRVCFLSFVNSESSVFNDTTRKFCYRENIKFFYRHDLPWMKNIHSHGDVSMKVLQGVSMLEKEYDCLFIDEYPALVTIIVYSSMNPALVTHRTKKLYHIIQIFRRRKKKNLM